MEDKNILVIGGAPSAIEELSRLKASGYTPDLVLSANEHGCFQGFYEVDWIVTVCAKHWDKQVPMEGYLRAFNKPIICVFDWADYRLNDWRFTGDSGLTAIAAAIREKAKQVIVTGLDGFSVAGRKYFHGDERLGKTISENVNHRRSNDVCQWKRRCNSPTEIRPMGGFLTHCFKRYEV